ncbi:hypothetical protein R5R35_014234 [Gryllus longicercus]|uniref:Uncharacterized protein n=1 Tax=Gryllus longicercus TaxID=2509291 RepID=A0AAN9YX95_9ORTH
MFHARLTCHPIFPLLYLQGWDVVSSRASVEVRTWKCPFAPPFNGSGSLCAGARRPVALGLTSDLGRSPSRGLRRCSRAHPAVRRLLSLLGIGTAPSPHSPAPPPRGDDYVSAPTRSSLHLARRSMYSHGPRLKCIASFSPVWALAWIRVLAR